MSAATPEKRWTVLELLQWTTTFFKEKDIESPRLDAECLLAHALETERLRLYLDFEKPASPEERARFRELVTRRADERIPVALLTGSKEFWSLPLQVTSDVLVPRPDTETLVEATVRAFENVPAPTEILDLGTGSGAIALALAKEYGEARITAVERSPAALEVAERNAESLELTERIRFLRGDLFEPVEGEFFDVIVSNPPYLAESEAPSLAPELAHEPKEALFAGPEGTEVLERIVKAAGARLRPGGFIALELAPAQAQTVGSWLEAAGFEGVQAHKDLGGRERVLTGTKPRGED